MFSADRLSRYCYVMAKWNGFLQAFLGTMLSSLQQQLDPNSHELHQTISL